MCSLLSLLSSSEFYRVGGLICSPAGEGGMYICTSTPLSLLSTYFILYFPVTGDVMRRVACHSGEALLFAVYDGRRCRGGSGRWGTVFCEVAGAAPARLGTAPAPARGVADQTSGGEPDPKSPSTGRGAWRPCTPRGSPPAAPLRGGAADSQGRRRTAGPLRASAWPTRAAPPPARARETSPAPVPQRVAGACGAGQVRPSAG